MRIAIAVMALAGVAHADGGAYVVSDLGGTAMRGDLVRYHAAVRLRGGIGLTYGDWAVEGWIAGDRGDLIPSSGWSCDPSPPATACADSGGGGGSITGLSGSMTSYGLDLRRAFTIVEGHPTEARAKWLHPRVQAFLHAGIRDAAGDTGMKGLGGTGFGAGGGFDLTLRVFSTYVEFGGDRYDFGDGMGNAQTWHVVLGERIGWGM